jgi:hypothetical protein
MKLPQLTLRDLFWLVLVCGVLCAWWVESTGLRGQLREANEKLEEAVKQALERARSY